MIGAGGVTPPSVAERAPWVLEDLAAATRRGPAGRPYTRQTITAPDRFRRALTVTRLTRVAVTRWEFERGVSGVAMPVFGPGGDVVAAIELAAADLGHELPPMTAALAVASRSLSRELATEPRRIHAVGQRMLTVH